MAAKAKQPDKPPIQMTVDDKWLDEYAEKVKAFGGTITEYEREATTDQADLSDVVEQQDADIAKQKERDKKLNEALGRGVVKGQKAKAQALAATKRDEAKEQALHERAKKIDAASEERIAKEKQREQELARKEAEEEEDEKRAKSIRDVRHVTQGINRALQNNVQPALERAGTLPTVGGIGLMVGILLVLLILIIPVNEAGDTRAKQFWYMLNGRAKLQGAVSPMAGSQEGTTATTPTTPGILPGIPNPLPGILPTIPVPFQGNSSNGSFRTTPNNLGF